MMVNFVASTSITGSLLWLADEDLSPGAKLAGFACVGVLLLIACFPIYVFVRAFRQPSKCELCQTPFRRKFHVWTARQGGEKVKLHLCPKCNSTFERRASKAATDKLFGGR